MQRNGGQLLVECLLGLGATQSFGVPGESYLAVLDALYDTKGKLDFTLCRNEGGASFMAAAYGKLTGSPGICFVTRGPGATNASIGIHTATQDSAPMLLFIGQVGKRDKGREAFQEIDYTAMYGSVAKWVVEIDDADRIPEILSRAWSMATSGRPGPVVVALPEDMLVHGTSASPTDGSVLITEPSPSQADVETALGVLKGSEKPLIIYGGSNWSSTGIEALQDFAEQSDIPVVSAFRYQDQYDNMLKTFCGEAGVGMPAHVKELIRESDSILALNVRFGEMTTDAYTLFEVPDPLQHIIHVHPSAAEIGKIYRPKIGIVSGPNQFAHSLTPITGDWAKWRQNAAKAYKESFDIPDQPSPVDMGKVTRWLQERLPEDAILTNGAGNFAVWPNKFFKFGPKARLLAPQSGAMGYGLTAAIAAKVVHPEKTVLCFAGDGDFQMNLQELASAAQADACPIVLILNNGIYGTIRAHQERNFPDRVSGTEMINPDFVALAKSYGFYSERVETTSDFEAAFERALASQTGAVLDLNVSPEALTPRVTLSDMRAAALKQHH